MTLPVASAAEGVPGVAPSDARALCCGTRGCGTFRCPETFVTRQSHGLPEGSRRGPEPWGAQSRESRCVGSKQLLGSLAGAAEEEPTTPLAPEVEKAPGSLVLGDKDPTAETQRSVRAAHSPWHGNQALTGLGPAHEL